MRLKVPLALVFALLGALPALAGSCPTRADLDKGGIRLTRSSPYMSVLLTKSGDTHIEERTTKRGGVTQRVRSTYLHPLAVAQRQDSKSVLTFKYGRNTKSLQRLDRDKVWTSPVSLLNGTETIDKGTVTSRFRGKGTLKVGGCSYAVWSVIEEVKLTKLPTSTGERIYAPELGVVLNYYRLGSDGKKRLSGFAPDSISAQ